MKTVQEVAWSFLKLAEYYMSDAQARKILDLPSNASEKDIKSAYKLKSLLTHPDKGGTSESFNQVQRAYEVLKGRSKEVSFGEYTGRFAGDRMWTYFRDLNLRTDYDLIFIEAPEEKAIEIFKNRFKIDPSGKDFSIWETLIIHIVLEDIERENHNKMKRGEKQIKYLILTHQDLMDEGFIEKEPNYLDNSSVF